MEKIETLVQNFLISHYGESFEVGYSDSKIYHPETFEVVMRRIYTINERVVCLVRNDDIDFDEKLLSTIQSLFNLNSSDLEPILDKWFHEKIYIN